MASRYPSSLWIRLPLLMLFLEVAFILIFSFLFSYDYDLENLPKGHNIYAEFQDVNVMVILGFAFLLASLKRFGFSATGFSLLLAALSVQWTMIVNEFLFHFSDGNLKISLQRITVAVMSTTAVMISTGAVLGKVNLMQLIWMAWVEATLFAVNRWVAVSVLQIESYTSLMHVHLFGAYFGVMVSWALCRPLPDSRAENEKSTPVSDTFAMLGTLFLWMFWPSFNAVLIASTEKRLTALINTYLGMAASAVAAFSISVATNRNGKLTMAHIRNATLAGGVALGFSASTLRYPWIAMIVGLGAGATSVLGFVFLKKCLEPAVRLHDTCGVQYTFGLPSLLGGIVHIVWIAIDSRENLSVGGYSALIEGGALCLSMALGLTGGLLTGFSLRLKLWKEPHATNYFDDQAYWGFPHLAVGY
ncbi:RH-like protein [Pogona vitticeps]